MKKALFKVLATGFALALAMSACSSSNEETKSETPAMTETAAPAAATEAAAPAESMEAEAPAMESDANEAPAEAAAKTAE